MFKLEKFYAEGFNPQQYWDTKYAREHVAGKSLGEYEKQGFWPILEKQLNKDKSYLDVGCGIGGWVLFLNEQRYQVKGIDIAARTIRALTEYDPDLDLRIASMTQIPYQDESFDGVLAIGVLEYVEDEVPDAIQEVQRVLKDGGMFFIEVPIANVLRRLTYIPLKKLEKTVRRGTPTFSNYLFDVKELKSLLQQHGFDVTAVHPHELPGADSHYGLYIDWPIFRGSGQYKLNALGRIVKYVFNTLSPWIASTGAVIVARKKA